MEIMKNQWKDWEQLKDGSWSQKFGKITIICKHGFFFLEKDKKFENPYPTLKEALNVNS